jgi:hypothetical protein
MDGRETDPGIPALDQKRGQTLDPKMVKHSWENTF